MIKRIQLRAWERVKEKREPVEDRERVFAREKMGRTLLLFVCFEDPPPQEACRFGNDTEPDDSDAEEAVFAASTVLSYLS